MPRFISKFLIINILLRSSETFNNEIVNDKGISVAEEREYIPLENINGNYFNICNDIKQENIIKFISCNKYLIWFYTNRDLSYLFI